MKVQSIRNAVKCNGVGVVPRPLCVSHAMCIYCLSRGEGEGEEGEAERGTPCPMMTLRGGGPPLGRHGPPDTGRILFGLAFAVWRTAQLLESAFKVIKKL